MKDGDANEDGDGNEDGDTEVPAHTLLFWSRRMMCSKQLLLRNTAWSTGRSWQLSMAGMASADREPGSAPSHLIPSSSPHSPSPHSQIPAHPQPTQHEHPQRDEAAGCLGRQGCRGQVGVEHPEVSIQKVPQGHGASAGAGAVQDVHGGHHGAQRHLQQRGGWGDPAATPLQHPQQHLQRRRRDGLERVGLRGWGHVGIPLRHKPGIEPVIY